MPYLLFVCGMYFDFRTTGIDRTPIIFDFFHIINYFSVSLTKKRDPIPKNTEAIITTTVSYFANLVEAK